MSRGRGQLLWEQESDREHGFDVISLPWEIRGQLDETMGRGLVDKDKCQGKMVLILTIVGE